MSSQNIKSQIMLRNEIKSKIKKANFPLYISEEIKHNALFEFSISYNNKFIFSYYEKILCTKNLFICWRQIRDDLSESEVSSLYGALIEALALWRDLDQRTNRDKIEKMREVNKLAAKLDNKIYNLFDPDILQGGFNPSDRLNKRAKRLGMKTIVPSKESKDLYFKAILGLKFIIKQSENYLNKSFEKSLPDNFLPKIPSKTKNQFCNFLIREIYLTSKNIFYAKPSVRNKIIANMVTSLTDTDISADNVREQISRIKK